MYKVERQAINYFLHLYLSIGKQFAIQLIVLSQK